MNYIKEIKRNEVATTAEKIVRESLDTWCSEYVDISIVCVYYSKGYQV